MKKKFISILVSLLFVVGLLFVFSADIDELVVENVTASEQGDSSEDFTPSIQAETIEQTDLYTVSDNFRIEIPSIALSKEIVPNVDPRDKNIYGPIIEENVAHGMFTRLPDETVEEDRGNVYLFAHRDGKYAFFNRLGELNEGDVIYIYYGDYKYIYHVTEYFIVSPKDTSVYTGNSDHPTLTLQTCNNGIKERLIVKADLSQVI